MTDGAPESAHQPAQRLFGSYYASIPNREKIKMQGYRPVRGVCGYVVNGCLFRKQTCGHTMEYVMFNDHGRC